MLTATFSTAVLPTAAAYPVVEEDGTFAEGFHSAHYLPVTRERVGMHIDAYVKCKDGKSTLSIYADRDHPYRNAFEQISSDGFLMPLQHRLEFSWQNVDAGTSDTVVTTGADYQLEHHYVDVG